MPKVSVVIPFYNVSAYIDKCIESLINQSLVQIEIIFINDCSTDNTRDIVLERMKKDSRIKLIENSENKGAGESRNIGILASLSTYVAFIDSDDYISKNYLEDFYNTAIKYNADMVFTNNIYIVGKKIKPNFNNRVDVWKKTYGIDYYEGISYFDIDSALLENIREYPQVMAANKMWKKSFLKDNNINFLSMRVGEDVDFFYRALVHKPVIAFNHKAIYYYIQRKSSAIGQVKNDDKMPITSLDVFESVFNYYKEKKIESICDVTYYVFYFFIYVFDHYNSSKKGEFYKLGHKLFKKLNPSIDHKKYPFLASQLYVFKTYENYSDYIKLIQDKKDRVNKIAWYIPTFAMREKYRAKKLDKIFKSFLDL